MAVFSYSSLSMLEKCGYSYWLQYVVRFKLPESAMADKTAVVPGKVIHTLANKFFVAGGQDFAIFDDEFDAVFDHYINKPYVHLGVGNAFAKDLNTARRCILQCKNNFVAEVKDRSLVQPFMDSEGRFETDKNPFWINTKIGLIGGWDLLCGPGIKQPLLLVDFKASESTYYLDKRQLQLYAFGVEKKLGVFVAQVAFLLFKKAKNRFISYAFSQQDREHIAAWIENMDAKRAREDFDPTPSEYACGLCGFREVCKYKNVKPSSIKEGLTPFNMPSAGLI